MKLKDSDADYIVFDTEDGFAIKISTKDEVFGVVGIHAIAFPEYLDEYLSIAHDIAKASGLALSNIRRYHEVSMSREEHVKLADMIRTTNRILRHDIANDLHIINGALDMFKERGDEQFLDMIDNAVHKGTSLIKNVKELDEVADIDGQLMLLNIKDLVNGVISRHAAEFNVIGDCMVMADNVLSSLFDNIVSNAIIHGNASKIDIKIMDMGDVCKISIADNGTGIPDGIKPRIFDEGYRYGKTGHTGFGLYIAWKTVERYNGSIFVEDNVPSGTKFIIELNAAVME